MMLRMEEDIPLELLLRHNSPRLFRLPSSTSSTSMDALYNAHSNATDILPACSRTRASNT